MTVTKELALDLLRRMALIRTFERRVQELFAAGQLPGFVHLYIGQEAVAAGVCASLRDDDYITSTHRGHGHLLAKGGDPARMMAELFGKEQGYCRGRGGSMHIADPSLGILGANGIVGAGIPIAAGAALASKYRQDGRVAVAFFGDGATGEGVFHETLNLASVFELPMVFVCENNHWAVSTEFTRVRKNPRIADTAFLYSMPGISVDGNDVAAVHEAAVDAVERARSGGGPTLIECDTYRVGTHFEGEPDNYRQANEVAQWSRRDPIDRWRQSVLDQGLLVDAEISAVTDDVEQLIDAATEFGRAADFPGPASALEDVYG